jgi:hypothetical protein
MMKVAVLRLTFTHATEFRILEPKLNLSLIEFLLPSCRFYFHSNELHQPQCSRVKLKILEIKESIKDGDYDICLVPEIFSPLFHLFISRQNIKLLVLSKQYDGCKEAVQNSSN